MDERFERVPTSSDAWQNIVDCLMCHRQGGETKDFSQRAIETLVKKLQDKQDELDSLITAITTNGARPSKCVTIPKSLDGRLQIAGKKGFPHVVFARIWRWPNARRYELAHVSHCQFAFDLRFDSVCVNPYHYTRVLPPGIEQSSEDLSGLKRQSGISGMNSGGGVVSGYPARGRGTRVRGTSTGVGGNGGRGLNQTVQCPSASPESLQQGAQQYLLPLAANNPAVVHQMGHAAENIQHQHPQSHQNLLQAQGQASSYPLNAENGFPNNQILFPTQNQSPQQFHPTPTEPTHQMGHAAENIQHQHPQSHQNSLQAQGQASPYLLNPENGFPNNQILFPTQNQSPQQFYPIPTEPTQEFDQTITEAVSTVNIVDDLDAFLAAYGVGTDQSSPVASVDNPDEEVAITYIPDAAQWTDGNAGALQLPDHQNFPSTSYWAAPDGNNNVGGDPGDLLSSQPPPEFWCSIGYYELDTQVGEPFKVCSQCPIVTVDGYTDARAGHRFCLGALTNVHRTEQSERARLYIAGGVVLYLRGEGDVWLQCQSQQSVFLQSYYLDKQLGRAPGEKTVHKIYPGTDVKVFDLRECHTQMSEHAARAIAAAAAQAAVVSGHSGNEGSGNEGVSAADAAIGVDDLRQFCIIRLSFVKGWGSDYPRRSIKETPCWIEVHLHRALQLLDEVLHKMPVERGRAGEF